MNRHSSIALLGATILLAGCGGSSKTTSANAPSSGALSGVRFVAKADAICQRLNTQFAASKPNGQDVSEIARIAPERTALEEQTVVELSHLVPPPTVAVAFRKIVADRRTLAQELAQLGDAAKRKDTKELNRLTASKLRMHTQLHSTASTAGFESCGLVG